MAGKPPPKRPAQSANPDYAEAARQLRRSSAASPHVPTPKKGTRSAKKKRAIQDSADT
jgi:hypothetical protein